MERNSKGLYANNWDLDISKYDSFYFLKSVVFIFVDDFLWVCESVDDLQELVI
jgi:hypothetical protein